MASKKGFIVVAILILLGGGAYWWLESLKTGADSTATDSGSADGSIPGEVSTGGMAENCGSDLACGNRFLAACNPAVFTAKGGALTVQTTILGKKDALCEIGSSVALSQLAGAAQPSADNGAGGQPKGDGKLSMTCTVPLGFDFARLTTWLQGTGINGCEGELREFYDSI